MKRWPLKETYFWETAPFFRLLLPLVVGIALYGHVGSTLGICGSLGLLSAITCGITGYIKNRNTAIQSLYLLSLQLAFICGGWLLSSVNDDMQQPAFFGKHIGKGNKYYQAIVTKTAIEKPRTYKIPVEILSVGDSQNFHSVSGRGLVYVYKNNVPISYLQGDTILLTDVWQPIKNAGNPYEFDYAQYAARSNIHYQQFISADKIQLLGRVGRVNIIDRVHNVCVAQLAKYLPDRKTLGLMQAMLIGDEVNLDKDTRQSYSETGIVHIIAISGSHITFFFILISFLLGWIRNRKYHWLKYILALPLIWFYVLMAGAAPSAIRAAVMFSLLSIGFALQKQPNSLNQLFTTAFILLCVEPTWLYSIGFQLSFLAVLSLILFYSRIYHLLTPRNKLIRGMWAAISASLAAELLVAPLVVYYFHLFPLWFIIANLAAYLFMGVVLVAGILIIVFSPIAIVAQWLGTATIFIVSLFNKLVVFFQANNPRSFSYLHIKGFDLVLLYLLIAAIIMFLVHRKSYSIWMASIAAAILTTSLLVQSYQASQQRRIVVYNINQKTYAEIIEGKRHSPLTEDTLSKSEYNYCVKPAHIQWHAWQENKQEKTQSIYTIGKSTLVISDSLPTVTAEPANYVVIGYPYKTGSVESLELAYHPEKLVFTSNLSRNQLGAWLDACKTVKMPVHAVASDGAFILLAR